MQDYNNYHSMYPHHAGSFLTGFRQSLRWAGVFLVAVFLTLLTVYCIQALVNQPASVAENKNQYHLIDFIQLPRRIIEPETIKRKLPPAPKSIPEPIKPRLLVKKMKQPKITSQIVIKLDMTSLQVPLSIKLPALSSLSVDPGQPQLTNDFKGIQFNEVMVVSKVPPRYPIRAARQKIEGWVKLKFTISETGTVNEVNVVDAKPSRIFNKAAKSAILKWRFKPKRVGGVNVATSAEQIIHFKLMKDPKK